MKIFEVYELWKYESQFSSFYQARDMDTTDKKQVSNTGGNRRFMNRNSAKSSNNTFLSKVKHMITSINYELTLNIISVLMLTEIAFNEAVYHG